MSTLSFDAAGMAYDRFMGRWSRLWIEALLAAAGVAPGRRVLDVGTGTGEAALAAVALVGPAPRPLATDLSVPMLRVAGTKLDAKRVALAAMDGQALACRSGGFDAVVSALGLMFFPDPARGLQEFRRVLRPGGRMAASVWSAASRAPFPAIMIEVLGRHLPEQKRHLEQAHSLGDADDLGSLLASAGFEAVSVSREARRVAFDGFDDFWAPIEAGGSRASKALLELPRATRQVVRNEMRADMGRFEQDGRLVLDVEMLIAAGRAP